MFLFPLKILSRLGTLILVGYIAWLAWQGLRSPSPQLAPERKEVAEVLIPQIVQDLRSARGPLRQVALLHFANDPTNDFTTALRRTIEASGVLNLQNRSVVERARELVHLPQPSHTSPADALADGRHRRTDGVLFGTIHASESSPGGTVLDVEIHLADVASGETVFNQRYREESPLGSGRIPPAAAFPWLQRLVGWALAVLLLPVFTIGFIRTLVRHRSNWSNAFLLGIYTMAAALLAWLSVGAALTWWLPMVGYLALVAAAFVYNVQIMTLAVKMEDA